MGLKGSGERAVRFGKEREEPRRNSRFPVSEGHDTI